MDILIRTIQTADNKEIAAIIRGALTEFGANKPGTAYYDEATDQMYETFQLPSSRYYVALMDGELVGGGGIFPTPGLPEGTGELVKMYLADRARGKGLGKSMIEKCLEFAKEAGYQHVYLETMPELRKAMPVYEKFGFRYLNGPMGNTGHFGCPIWMMKDL
jgi:putative acetyltransferase